MGKAVYAAFELLATEKTLDPLYQQLAEVARVLSYSLLDKPATLHKQLSQQSAGGDERKADGARL